MDNLFPCFDADRWLEIQARVRRESTALLSAKNELVFVAEAGPEIGCARSVRCRTVVRLVRSMKGKRGQTRYLGSDVDRGTFLTVGGGGGQFIQVTIHIEIKLDLSATGKKLTEENRKVREERAAAGKRNGFKRLPLEFILIHEEQHADDICQRLTQTAARRLRCDMSQAEIDEMLRQMQFAYDRIIAQANHADDDGEAGGAQSALEEDVRRRTWEQWDQRHPIYNET